MALIPGIIFCLCIFFLLPRTNFYRASALSSATMYGLLFIKAFIAIFFAFLMLHYYPTGDHLSNNQYGILTYKDLIENPALFFSDFGQNNYDSLGNVFSSGASFWDDLSVNILAKALGFFNIITRGNFYLNSVLFSFIGFTGSVALYRLFKCGVKNQLIPIGLAFFIPSAMLFTAAIHKDTIVFFAVSMAIYCLYSIYRTGFSLANSMLLLFYCFVLFCFRNYFFFTLIPVIVIVLLFNKLGIKKSVVAVYTVLAVLLIGGILFSNKLDANRILAERRSDFANLQPGTYSFVQQPMSPGIQGIIVSTPQALYNVLIRPAIFKAREADAVLFMIESWIIIFILLAGIAAVFKSKFIGHEYVPLLLYSLSILLIIGFTINNSMAIIRYRSIMLPILLVVPIMQIQHSYIKK